MVVKEINRVYRTDDTYDDDVSERGAIRSNVYDDDDDDDAIEIEVQYAGWYRSK